MKTRLIVFGFAATFSMTNLRIFSKYLNNNAYI